MNPPIPIQVMPTISGKPAILVETRNGSTNSIPVKKVLDLWDLDDEWWRIVPIHRRYFKLLIDTGRVMTIFKDQSSGEWFRQEY